jgi:ferredoxin-NADP reductase
VPVAEVVTEAGDACSLVLAVPPDLVSVFAYQPGQFLTDGYILACQAIAQAPEVSISY